MEKDDQSVYRHLWQCRIGTPVDRKLILRWTSQRLPAVISEHPILLKGYDKAFASVWIDDKHVLIGNKESKVNQCSDLSEGTHSLTLLYIAPKA